MPRTSLVNLTNGDEIQVELFALHVSGSSRIRSRRESHMEARSNGRARRSDPMLLFRLANKTSDEPKSHKVGRSDSPREIENITTCRVVSYLRRVDRDCDLLRMERDEAQSREIEDQPMKSTRQRWAAPILWLRKIKCT